MVAVRQFSKASKTKTTPTTTISKMGCRCDFFGIFCFLFLYLLIGYVDYVCVFQILAIDQE